MQLNDVNVIHKKYTFYPFIPTYDLFDFMQYLITFFYLSVLLNRRPQLYFMPIIVIEEKLREIETSRDKNKEKT